MQRRFSSATVAVCGLGGLGSNIAIALARAGVGKLILIDFDSVDITNLHRQQYKVSQIGMNKTDALSENLREIAPYIELTAYTVRITEENAVKLLKDSDIICEAFDNAEAKAMLTNLILETMLDKCLVFAVVKGFGINQCQYQTCYAASKSPPPSTHSVFIGKLCGSDRRRTSNKCSHDSTGNHP